MSKNMSALRPFLFALLLAATAAACTPRRIDIGNDITVQRLAEGIYLYTAVDEIEGYGPVPSNGVLIVREGEAVLLDTPVGDAQTKALTDWAAETLRARVTTFVPNHWHSDCMGGLGYLKTLGVKSYAHRLTRSIAQREGKPVPDIGFSDSLRLDLHGTEIRCYYFGGGHSEDNIAVWIPSAKLLFAGCMVKEMAAQNAGNLSDAVPAAWPATLVSRRADRRAGARRPRRTRTDPPHPSAALRSSLNRQSAEGITENLRGLSVFSHIFGISDAFRTSPKINFSFCRPTFIIFVVWSIWTTI